MGKRKELADDAVLECQYLADWIERNGSRRPTITEAWLDAARRLHEIDGRSHEQIMACIEWSQRDEFWHTNILSMPTLRKQYDRMRLQARRRAGSRRQTPGSIRAAIARGEA